MSYCKEMGKDQVIFLTEEDAAKPSTVELPEPAPGEAPQGLLTETGEINWGCPCLGGMAVGPCGVEFREAFSCFHYSEAEPKGSECFEKFVVMQECMKNYPELYDKSGQGDDDVDDGELHEAPIAELDLEQQTHAPEIPVTSTDNSENRETKTLEISDNKTEDVSSKVEEVSTETKVAEISESVEKVKIDDKA